MNLLPIGQPAVELIEAVVMIHKTGDLALISILDTRLCLSDSDISPRSDQVVITNTYLCIQLIASTSIPSMSLPEPFFYT